MTSSVRYISFDCLPESWSIFSRQFISVIHEQGHSDGVKRHLVPGSPWPDPCHVPPTAHLSPIITEVRANQCKVYMLLLLASESPSWPNLFASILVVEDPPDYCGADRGMGPRSGQVRPALFG